MNKAVFFDRDGTLNWDNGYTHQVDDLRWIDGAMAALEYCHHHHYKIIVITNQSGIGRGFYNLAQMQEFHQAMNHSCGGLITQFYHCPHVPDDHCPCRKPKNLLLEQALSQHNLARAQCFFIGDKESDQQCARASQVQFAYYQQGSLYDVITKLF